MPIFILIASIPVIALYITKLIYPKRFYASLASLREKDIMETGRFIESNQLLSMLVIYQLPWFICMLFTFTLYGEVTPMLIFILLILIVISSLLSMINNAIGEHENIKYVINWANYLIGFALSCILVYYTSIIHLI